ncbi:hypothetical protein XAP6164_3520003 [Xanthomonas phaseoli pv. phaseoli]|nr:hypothetical protein XAP6164_3520003 [Xanthomonas phaseoli pv. phaseoli]
MISHFEMSGRTQAPARGGESWRESDRRRQHAAPDLDTNVERYERAAPPRVLSANHANILDPRTPFVRDGIGTSVPTCTFGTGNMRILNALRSACGTCTAVGDMRCC